MNRASSTFADSSSTLFEPSYDATITYDSDLSNLINASHVSHAIASSYHALTTQALLQHNTRYSCPRRSSIEFDTTRAHHTSQVSASLDELRVELAPHLHTNAPQGYVDTTPMALFEAYPSSQYQQLGNYNSITHLQSGYTPPRTAPEGVQERNDSMKAELGTTQGQNPGCLTYWVPDRERYMYARRNDRDMTNWGEDLSGVGTHFNAYAHSEETTPNGIVGEEGWNAT